MVRMHKTHDKELLSSGQWHFGKNRERDAPSIRIQ